jgi:hypothetical protein
MYIASHPFFSVLCSEKIWSRAALILYLCYVNLKDEFFGCMMLIKDNLKFLLKQYCQWAKEDRQQHLHHLVELELNCLPQTPEKDDIDVDKDDLFVMFESCFVAY